LDMLFDHSPHLPSIVDTLSTHKSSAMEIDPTQARLH